ncbi:IS4 family transposase [Massilia sp. S19_KUP03_FR1]|uniref:IS4 family transposase n=1 Tax=Massilia sp. S19_KUP03_FR1 TaxID=3025503 RepID=UPI002FCD97BD
MRRMASSRPTGTARAGKSSGLPAAKKTPPDKPGLHDVLRQLACIGGFLACKSDGEPGVKTIWLGLKDVHVAAETIRTLREMGALKSCV